MKPKTILRNKQRDFLSELDSIATSAGNPAISIKAKKYRSPYK